MLDIKRLRSEPDEVRKALERRGIDAPLDDVRGAGPATGDHRGGRREESDLATRYPMRSPQPESPARTPPIRSPP